MIPRVDDNTTPQAQLEEAARYFADLDRCDAYLAELRWPGGRPYCRACGSVRIGAIVKRRRLRCKDCRRQFSHRVGTPLQDSRIRLDQWFVALWTVAHGGISSRALACALAVTQKTAWYMLRRIRAAMEAADCAGFDGAAQADAAASVAHVADEGKPAGWSQFDALARRVVAVPKSTVEDAIARTPKRKRRRGTTHGQDDTHDH
jgi:transposase-like protein